MLITVREISSYSTSHHFNKLPHFHHHRLPTSESARLRTTPCNASYSIRPKPSNAKNPFWNIGLVATQFGFTSNEGMNILATRTKSHAFRMMVSATKNSNKEVTMVDPLEAKRLADKQMQQIKAKEKYKRKREIEAINGGWAMIGLTVGLVIEGRTGNGILKQLVSYWDTIVGFWFH